MIGRLSLAVLIPGPVFLCAPALFLTQLDLTAVDHQVQVQSACSLLE